MTSHVRTHVLAGAPGNVTSVPWDTPGRRERRKRRGSVKVKWVWHYRGMLIILISLGHFQIVFSILC